MKQKFIMSWFADFRFLVLDGIRVFVGFYGSPPNKGMFPDGSTDRIGTIKLC